MPAKTLGDLYAAIRAIPNFPTPGVLFRDITPLLLDADLLQYAIAQMTVAINQLQFDKVVAIESRGFLFGVPVATGRGVGLVPARKRGKLPWKTHAVEYALEYGTDVIEIHQDSVESGERVLIVDDLLATGGTAHAAAEATRQAGAVPVGVCVLIELLELRGRERLSPLPVWSALTYPEPLAVVGSAHAHG